ncbi:carbohydrate-binding protein [Parachryseolinea silvisoli]|uniref:carbohydrate-binding protein n=1 Tax=Parachryseolinea silvisoli TaxID=2873601 RepID=UPI0022658621|nr:carbohydrate-binding protein [Parachryseolinea silvisoli]MCD9018920.1 carbohydrate-binding protein [Parachryseolinea silvisoli]
MKFSFTKLTCAAFLLLAGITAGAQDKVSLGTVSALKKSLVPGAGQRGAASLQAALPGRAGVQLNINHRSQQTSDDIMLIGSIQDQQNSTFFLHIQNNTLRGNIILKDQRVAYEYISDAAGNAYLQAKDIDKVLCLDYTRPTKPEARAAASEPGPVAMALNNLQSLPGANAVVFLDFDGYNMPAGTGWNNGNPINAAASGMSDAAVQETWEVISEDFRPYNINITTSETVYNSYAVNRRQRCVFTPTNTAAPGAGGVAFVGGFGYQDWPCWVFVLSGKGGGEAGAHEIGHTVGLGHDGRTNPSEGYFAGHGDWAPIMGVGYYEPITQWSKGEYNAANNKEDDLTVMTRFIQFRNDDHGNASNAATALAADAAGTLSARTGLIERTADVDFFSFNTGTGSISLDINTVSRHGDLDVLVRLYEGASGAQIGTFNGTGLNTHLDANLTAGVYYISVDGTGAGDPATNGYSDYASLGSYTITGRIVPSTGTNGVATFYKDCNYGGYAVSLPEGNYLVTDLQARGIVNDDISSLRVQAGYQVTLYLDNNYTGTTVVKTADDACLVDDNFNDLASSVRIARTAGASTVIEAESFTSMSGVTNEACSEGGQSVGYIETGDWMAYSGVSFPTAGTYTIEYRVASESTGGQLSVDINAGATVLGYRDIPATGGWQNWTTVSHTVTAPAGTYSLGLYAQSGGWNINWIRITRTGAAATTFATTTPSGTSAARELSSVQVYPNPVRNVLTVTAWDGGDQGKARIVDQNGKTTELQLQNNSADVSALKPGLYILQLQNGAKREVKKFIKE